MSLMAMAAGPESPEEVSSGPFTRAELARLPDDGRRHEILDGVLIVSAAPGRMHQRAGCPSFWVVDPVARPDGAALVAWELDGDGAYRQVAKVVGDEPFAATIPFPLTVVPAALVR